VAWRHGLVVRLRFLCTSARIWVGVIWEHKRRAQGIGLSVFSFRKVRLLSFFRTIQGQACFSFCRSFNIISRQGFSHFPFIFYLCCVLLLLDRSQVTYFDLPALYIFIVYLWKTLLH